MTPFTLLTVLTATWALPTEAPRIHGLATYYAPGLMEQVAANRALDLTSYAGGVALNRAGDLGRVVWLTWSEPVGAQGLRPDLIIDGPFLVVDCAAAHHYTDRERAAPPLVVEIAYDLAVQRGLAGWGPKPVIVHFSRPYPDRRR